MGGSCSVVGGIFGLANSKLGSRIIIVRIVKKGNFSEKMTMMVGKHGEFSVKVVHGPVNAIPKQRAGLMKVNQMCQKIIFLFDFRLTISFKTVRGFPWLAPPGSSLAFWIKGDENIAFFVKFECNRSMVEVHEILKRKCLVYHQFSPKDLPGFRQDFKEQKARIQHMANPADIENVRTWLDQFTLDSALEPTAKRSRSKNSVRSRGISLTSFYDGIFPSKKSHTDSERDGIFRNVNVETSGFENLGNTCYMNSILQGMFANAIFVKDLFKFCKMLEELGLDLDEEMPLSLAVANLASRRDSATNQLKKHLLKMIKIRAHFWNNAQQDALEFLVSILSQIEEECDVMLCKQYGIQDKKERNTKNPVTSNFAFVIESSIKCDRCEAITKNEEESVILPVSIQMLEQDITRSKEGSTFATVQTMIDEHLKTERRYVFEASCAVKREDKVGIPMHLKLSDNSSKFPPLSPTTKKIDFKTATMLKIKGCEDEDTESSTETESVRSPSVEPAEFVSKHTIPNYSATVAREIIYSQNWNALKADNETTSKKYCPPSPVSRKRISDKLDVESKMVSLNTVDKKTERSVISVNMLAGDDKNSDNLLVYPMPVPRKNDLDHDYVQTTSSEGKNRNLSSQPVQYFIEALKKAKLVKELEKEKSVDSESLSNERRANWRGSKVVATDMNSLAVAEASRATAGHGEKRVEEIDTSKKASAAKECSAVFDSTDSYEKSRESSIAHLISVEASKNYFADLGSKINVLTPDGKQPFQSESTLEAKRSAMQEEQKLVCSFYNKTQIIQASLENPPSKDYYTDEDLYFMTEDEQIFAACKRSIADQLRKDNETSATISLNSDEERSRMQCAHELMDQKLSPNIDKDLEVDVEVVEETADYTQKFEKQESEQSVDKLMIQKSSSDTNINLNVDKMVMETGDHPENFKQQKGENMNKLFESFENAALTTDINKLFVPEDHSDKQERTNEPEFCPDCEWTTSRNTGSTVDENTMDATEKTSSQPTCDTQFLESSSPNLRRYLTYSNYPLPATTSLSLKHPNDDEASKLLIKSLPSANNDLDVESIGNSDDESSQSSISDGFSNKDADEVFEVFGPQPIPYIPLSYDNRQSICMCLGMVFNVDWMVQCPVIEMDLYDRPIQLVDIEAICNCLFQSLAYYIAGSERDYQLLRNSIIRFEMDHPVEFAAIKGWTKNQWMCHIRLLTEIGLGADLELYAFATMFDIDVWVFHKGQWHCYRPRFQMLEGKSQEISVGNYRIGENEGVYLMYENCLFSPVLIPSNEIFLNKLIPTNSDDSSDNTNFTQDVQPKDGFYDHNDDVFFDTVTTTQDEVHDDNDDIFSDAAATIYDEVYDDNDDVLFDTATTTHEDTTQESYRLISVVSHLGQTTDRGHYICDAWCNKSKSWLFCNDESIIPIDEKSVLGRCRTGYVYLYLNSELFESQ
ncbi:Ubiquitin carboxyl-terminal hydrolase family protein [Acanthocheilonema viteae]